MHIEFSFKGDYKCKFVYRTLSDCKCKTCDLWLKSETIEIQDSSVMVGRINFEKKYENKKFGICNNHIISFYLASFNEDLKLLTNKNLKYIITHVYKNSWNRLFTIFNNIPLILDYRIVDNSQQMLLQYQNNLNTIFEMDRQMNNSIMCANFGHTWSGGKCSQCDEIKYF